MKHIVEHDLSQDLARSATEKAWEAYSQRFSQYKPTIVWSGDTHADVGFNVKGISLKGTIDLEPGGVALELDVPFVFRIFRKQAIEVIEREIQTWIDKAKAGEL